MKVLNDGKMTPAEDLYSQKRRSEVFQKRTIKSFNGAANSKVIDNSLASKDAEVLTNEAIENSAIRRYQLKQQDVKKVSLRYKTGSKSSYNKSFVSSTQSNNPSLSTPDASSPLSTSSFTASSAEINEAQSELRRNKIIERKAAYKKAEQSNTSSDASTSINATTKQPKSLSASGTYARGTYTSSVLKNTNSTDISSIGIKKAQQEARIKRYVKTNRSKLRRAAKKPSVKAKSAVYAKRTARVIEHAANTKKTLYFLLAGAFALILVVIIFLVIIIVSVFRPRYSTLTIRELMKVYENAWQNTLVDAALAESNEEVFGYLYGDPGIDWRMCLSIYYADLLGDNNATPEADLDLASNASVLDNETGSLEGNKFGRIFWLLNDVVETSAIRINYPDDLDDALYYQESTGTYYTRYETTGVDTQYMTLVPIIHRDPEVVMDILGFTEWQKTTARMYYEDPAYDSYFSGIVNSLNYGPSDLMVWTALQEEGNTGLTYRNWYDNGRTRDWCVCFATWCGYQCGYSTRDGQLGIIPPHNDTTGLYNWYRQHPESGTAYYCYRGSMSPDDIPICPGSFIIWENNGNTIHQEHLSIVTNYYPETHTFDTVDGNSYTGPQPALYENYFVAQHTNRDWSSNIYAIICPNYPEENPELEYSPLEQAINDARYPTNYAELNDELEQINVGARTICGTFSDMTVDEAISQLNWFIDQGVDTACLTEVPYHSYNLPGASYGEQQGWDGMDYIVQGQPSNAHLRFYDGITIPDWYFSGGYYDHVQYCGADPHSN